MPSPIIEPPELPVLEGELKKLADVTYAGLPLSDFPSEIDVGKVRYQLLIYTWDNRKVGPVVPPIDLSDAISELHWGEEPGTFAATATGTMNDAKTADGVQLREIMRLGMKISIKADWGIGLREIFFGEIMIWEPMPDEGTFQWTAHDELHQVLRSKDDIGFGLAITGEGDHLEATFTDFTAIEIMKRILGRWHRPVAPNTAPTTVIPSSIYRQASIGSVLQSILQRVRDAGDGEWILRFSPNVQPERGNEPMQPVQRPGAIEFLEMGSNPVSYALREDSLARGNRMRASTEELVTVVKVVTTVVSDISVEVPGDEPIVIPMNLTDSSEYIVTELAKNFDQIVDIVEGPILDKPNTMIRAQRLLNEKGQPTMERTIVAPDLPFLRRWDKVYVEYAGINGLQVIEGIQHDVTSGLMTIELKNLAPPMFAYPLLYQETPTGEPGDPSEDPGPGHTKNPPGDNEDDPTGPYDRDDTLLAAYQAWASATDASGEAPQPPEALEFYLGTSYLESGWNPNARGDQDPADSSHYRSYGPLQWHEAGIGSGYSQSDRTNPYFVFPLSVDPLEIGPHGYLFREGWANVNIYAWRSGGAGRAALLATWAQHAQRSATISLQRAIDAMEQVDILKSQHPTWFVPVKPHPYGQSTAVDLPKRDTERNYGRLSDIPWASWPYRGHEGIHWSVKGLDWMDVRSPYHRGMDLGVSTDQNVTSIRNVYAPGAGIVTRVRKGSFVGDAGENGYGNLVEIKHSKTMSSVLAHLDSVLVKTGDIVTAQTAIGREGATGMSNGNACTHFELWLSVGGIRKRVAPRTYCVERAL